VYPGTSFGCWAVAIEGLRFGLPCRTSGQRRFGAVKADDLRCPEGHFEGQDRLGTASRGGAAWACPCEMSPSLHLS
jgi:hypothetical protein